MRPKDRAKIGRARASLVRALGLSRVQIQEPYHKRKIIHDPIWGTCKYETWEAALLDLEVFQRLRGLKQTGFAYLTYPAAEHSRFQHSLGVVEAASRVFNSIVDRLSDDGLGPGAKAAGKRLKVFRTESARRRWRILLRVAALVHDTGHSLFSHTSERIYGLVPQLQHLSEILTGPSAKRPGAAEVVVYLLVTSTQWQRLVARIWRQTTKSVRAPTPAEWERIGRWIMGQETDPSLKFLADIISGPLDADKLDYISRDGYSAGIPVGYDLARLISTICVDPQRATRRGRKWWRLTLPIRGINALEQLVMGRLVLNSYLYHHQKCRAAEAAFERALAREHVRNGTIAGRRNIWDLFSLRDADLLEFARKRGQPSKEAGDLIRRTLRVQIAQFRYEDLRVQSERASVAFNSLLELGVPRTWTDYRALLRIEDTIARMAGLKNGSVIVDIPKAPSYADLENLLLPGRTAAQKESPTKVLNYRDWIAAYSAHRTFVRVFCPRGQQIEDAAWNAARRYFASTGLVLSRNVRFRH